jgi:hypothetical protein
VTPASTRHGKRRLVCTLYMADAIDALRAEGLLDPDDDLSHLSPTVNAHINAYGRYEFAVERELARTGRRPLRRPDPAGAGLPAIPGTNLDSREVG